MPTKTRSTSLTKRLAADAWQHVLAGHLSDFSCEARGWIYRVAGDSSPYADDEGMSDAAFRDVLAGLPAHGEAVIVRGAIPSSVILPPKGSSRELRFTPKSAFPIPTRTETVYPELAGGEVAKVLEVSPPAVTVPAEVLEPVAEIAEVPEIRPAATGKAVSPKVSGPASAGAAADELRAYVDRLVYAPKRLYAARVVAVALAGGDLSTVDRCGLSAEVADKVLAKVARIMGKTPATV